MYTMSTLQKTKNKYYTSLFIFLCAALPAYKLHTPFAALNMSTDGLNCMQQQYLCHMDAV